MTLVCSKAKKIYAKWFCAKWESLTGSSGKSRYDHLVLVLPAFQFMLHGTQVQINGWTARKSGAEWLEYQRKNLEFLGPIFDYFQDYLKERITKCC